MQSLCRYPITILNAIGIILILLFLPSLFVKFPDFISNLKYSLVELSSIKDLYDDTAEIIANQTGSSLANLGGVFRSAFSEVLVFFTFYYFSLYERNKWISIGLCIALLQPLLSSFSMGSRTMITWWFAEVVCAYLLFIPYFSSITKKYSKRFFTLICCCVFLVFAVLTFGRFSTKQSNDAVQSSVVAYMGQGTINFSTDVLDNEVKQYGDNSFPFFRQLLGLDVSRNLYERQSKWARRMNVRQGAFYTFVGDLCFDFGPIIAFILISIFSYGLTRKLHALRTQKNVEIGLLFLLFFWCCLCYDGLFYFHYKSMGGNLKIVTNVLFYICLLIIHRNYSLTNKYI
jgi:oligosaccharide repeat unit polymerase